MNILENLLTSFVKIYSDNSYVVQAEMIKQLGIVGDVSDIDLIENYTKKWSPRKIVNNAAYKAIALLKE